MEALKQHLTTYFGITNNHLEEVSSLFVASDLKKGEYFLKSGQYCKKLSFVQSGFIRLFAQTERKEVTQWICPPNHFLTELSSFIFKQPVRWHMQALTDCKLHTISSENYNRLINLVPNWEEIEKQFIAACFITLENRVFSHLSLSAEERYDQLFEQNRELFNQVPLQYLASMLGMSPETFSRIRNKKIY